MPVAEPGPPAEVGDDGIRWQHPSPRLLRARRIQVGLVTIPAALIGGLAGSTASAALGLGLGLGLVIAGLLWERFLARRVAAWGYAERHQDLMVRRGVLVRRLSVIPYGRMQFIDVTAGPVERSLATRHGADAHRGRGQRRAHPRPGPGGGSEAARPASRAWRVAGGRAVTNRLPSGPPGSPLATADMAGGIGCTRCRLSSGPVVM